MAKRISVADGGVTDGAETTCVRKSDSGAGVAAKKGRGMSGELVGGGGQQVDTG